MLTTRIELVTSSLPMRCATDCAMSAYLLKLIVSLLTINFKSQTNTKCSSSITVTYSTCNTKCSSSVTVTHSICNTKCSSSITVTYSTCNTKCSSSITVTYLHTRCKENTGLLLIYRANPYDKYFIFV